MSSFSEDALVALIESKFLEQTRVPGKLQPDALIGWRENKESAVRFVYPICIATLYPHCPRAKELYSKMVAVGSYDKHLWMGINYPIIIFIGEEANYNLFAPFIQYCTTGEMPFSGIETIVMAKQMGTAALLRSGRELYEKKIADPEGFLLELTAINNNKSSVGEYLDDLNARGNPFPSTVPIGKYFPLISEIRRMRQAVEDKIPVLRVEDPRKAVLAERIVAASEGIIADLLSVDIADLPLPEVVEPAFPPLDRALLDMLV